MKSLGKILTWIEDITIGASAILIILFILLTVVLRYLFNTVLTWPDELSRYLQIYLIWMGASASFRKGSQLKIDILAKIFPSPKSNRIMDIVSNFICLGGCILLVIAVLLFVHNRWVTAEKSMVLSLPLWIVGFGMLLSAVFMVIRLLQSLAVALSSKLKE